MITTPCPECNIPLEFPASAAGKVVRCPDCNGRFRVPEDEAVIVGKPKRRRKARPVEEMAGDSSWNPFIFPVILFLIGCALTIASASKVAARAEDIEGGSAISFALGSLAFQVILGVPFTIITLYVAASLLGTSYGYLSEAVVKLAAITVFTSGLSWACQAMGMPGFGVFAITMLTDLVLFKVLFELDLQELLMTIFVMNIAQWLFTMLMMTALMHAAR